MTGLSEQQLAEIQERILNATPGPWELYEDYGKNFYANVRGEMLLPVGSIEFGDGDTADADRALVEHAAEDLSLLLAEVARLRGALSEATGYVAELEADLGGWSARVAELETSAARKVQCGDCGAYGDVDASEDGLLYLYPSGQIGHPRATSGGAS